MNRRTFLRSLGLVTAAATVDRKYFFAPTAGWSPNPVLAWMNSGGSQSFSIKFPHPGSYRFELGPGNLWVQSAAIKTVIEVRVNGVVAGIPDVC